MAAKALLVFCASALFIHTISCQCIGNALNAGYLNNDWDNGLAYGSGLGLGLGNGLGWNNRQGCNNGLGSAANFGAAGLNAATSGGALGVSSVSPLYPSGLAVHSDNAIGGRVDLAGILPFVSAVVLEGEVPSAGSAGVNYSCGNGNIGIERVGATGIGYGAGIGHGAGLGAVGHGYGAGIGYGTGIGHGAGLGAVGHGYGAGLGNGYGLGGALGGIRSPCGCAHH